MINKLLILMLIATCYITSCTKSNEAINTKKATTISNGQAATMIAASLATSSYGFTSIKNDITLYARNLGATAGKGCNIEDDIAFARQEPSIASIKYNYAVGYKNTVNCQEGKPDFLSSVVITNGSFDTPMLSSIQTANSTINVGQLRDATATSFNLTGVYQTSGSFQTVDDTELAGTNTINLGINNMLLKRSDRAIVSGTADVSVSGMVKSNKNTFNYTGTIVFESANVATLDLDGSKYSINLTTGDVTNL